MPTIRRRTQAFWRHTVLPLTGRTLQALSAWLGAAWGGGLELRMDLDAIQALSAERDALWSRVGAAAFLSDDEKRAAVGYGAGAAGTDDFAENKFSAAQPRVPAGTSEGGQWAGSGVGTAGSPVIGEGIASEGAQHSSEEIIRQMTALVAFLNEHQGAQDAAYHGLFHDAVRDDVVKALRSVGTAVETEVTLILPGVVPFEARLDILARGPRGALYGIEIKTGDDPPFTPGQMVVYPHAVGGAGVFSPNSRVSSLGLTPFIPLPAFPITAIYAPAPGAPYQFFELDALPK